MIQLKGNVRTVNTYRYFKHVMFKQAQENRRARKRRMHINGLTLEQIDEKYKEERALSYEVAREKEAAYGKKFIAYSDA